MNLLICAEGAEGGAKEMPENDGENLDANDLADTEGVSDAKTEQGPRPSKSASTMTRATDK